jgi:ATP-dependent exoDNAse (exonuclease V) beta subunit
MTVHAAKGLEFPVVILADMTASIAQRNPDKYVNGTRRLCAAKILGCTPWDLIDHSQEEQSRDQAEGSRVAYVAATRARDLLVVSAVGDEQREGWLRPLNKALYPPRTSFRKSTVAIRCPAFGEATVLKRPVEFDGMAEASVRPGLHRPEQGGHSVVWWDPSTLRLDVEPSFGLSQEDILIEGDGVRARESVASYEQWRVSREAVIAAGAKPSLDVFIATDAVEPPEGYADSVRITRVPRSERRPKGSRFGSLVHLVLRDVDFTASEDAVERVTRTHARIVAAPDEEVTAAIGAVLACLKHPLLDLARKSSKVHREWPVVARTDDGKILDAIIDLAFEDSEGWIVLDFKTDAEDLGRVAKYRRQVGWYVRGVEVALGKRPQGWLLHV